MTTRRKLLAIINPISGGVNKESIPELIENHIDSSLYDCNVRFTIGPNHATKLATEAIALKYYGVIAVGGDGTINEVASAIRDSDVALGIVPCGSGNGLARHLNIPLEIAKAMEIINENNIEYFDYCKVNNIPFFCTCGVGFDAHISNKFAESKKRGAITYFKKTLAEYLKYRSQVYEIDIDNQRITEKAFVIACGNASQYGNNAYITPNADMQDGFIDVTIIHPFTPLDTALLGLLLFTKHIDQDTNINCFRAKEISIHRPTNGIMHLDGEPMIMPADLHIKCIHNGIKIFVSKKAKERTNVLTPIEDGFWNYIKAIREELNI